MSASVRTLRRVLDYPDRVAWQLQACPQLTLTRSPDGWRVCSRHRDSELWLQQHDLYFTRYATRSSLLDVLLAHLAAGGPPVPSAPAGPRDPDRHRLRRVSAGEHRSVCGVFIVRRRSAAAGWSISVTYTGVPGAVGSYDDISRTSTLAEAQAWVLEQAAQDERGTDR